MTQAERNEAPTGYGQRTVVYEVLRPVGDVKFSCLYKQLDRPRSMQSPDPGLI